MKQNLWLELSRLLDGPDKDFEIIYHNGNHEDPAELFSVVLPGRKPFTFCKQDVLLCKDMREFAEKLKPILLQTPMEESDA